MKVTLYIDKIKQDIKDTFKLVWLFKWYVFMYLSCYIFLVIKLFNISADGVHTINSATHENMWIYTNTKVYEGHLHSILYQYFLLFFVGTSNMRNHPLLAKLIFLWPLISLAITR